MENQETINVNEIVELKQLPIITQKLEKVSEYIKKELDGIDDMVCNEENKQQVKNIRTNINNTLKAFEDKRKSIKEACLKDYTDFENNYKTLVKDQLTNASEKLSNKINEIEIAQKQAKNDELLAFANEYITNYHLEDILTYENIPINVTLSASMKSLKDEIVAFTSKISSEIETINKEENKEEILLEYKKNGFDYARAKLEVINRHQELEKLKESNDKAQELEQQEKQVIENVDTLVTPPKEIEQQEITETIFEIVNLTLHNVPKTKLLALQEYLKEQEIAYD